MIHRFLADIIGTGEGDSDEFRPAVALYTHDWSAEMPADPVTGKLLNKWAMVEVRSGDYAQMDLDLGIDAMPFCELSTPVAQIDSVQLWNLREALSRRGIGAGITIGVATYGDIVAAIALRANAGTVDPTKAQLVL